MVLLPSQNESSVDQSNTILTNGKKVRLTSSSLPITFDDDDSDEENTDNMQDQSQKSNADSIKQKSKRIGRPKVYGPHKATQATKYIKKIIRLFRNSYISDKNYYKSKKMTVEGYFTKIRFNFPQSTFKDNVCIFEKLLGHMEVADEQEICHTIQIVFNKSPSKTNLEKFFQNHIIKDLWWGHYEYNHSSFIDSQVLKEYLHQLDPEMRYKVY